MVETIGTEKRDTEVSMGAIIENLLKESREWKEISIPLEASLEWLTRPCDSSSFNIKREIVLRHNEDVKDVNNGKNKLAQNCNV